MSLSASNDHLSKADQIAHKFFNKVALLVNHARTTPLQPLQKVEKWFNLEIPDTDRFRNELLSYRSLASKAEAVPPLELQVLLSVPELLTNQVLVLADPNSARVRIDPTPSYVLLESWVVVFHPDDHSSDETQQLSSVYKQSISIFRSLFTLLRLLPAWKLCRKLRRPDASNLSIEVRVADPTQETPMLKFGAPLSSSVAAPLPTSSHAFPPVHHPSGTITITATYLISPLFQTDTLESLLSSRFLSQEDEGFTPTLTARQQTPPMRSSLPRSPPGTNLADRFVLPANPPSSTAGGTPSSSSLPIRSRPNSLLNSATGSSQDVTSPPPSTAQALSIRRPSINAIHPFKSSTLSSTPHSHSSSSLRHSPLSISGGGPSLPSRPPPSPTTRIGSSPSRMGVNFPSSVTTTTTSSSSPRTQPPLPQTQTTYPPSPMSSRPPSLLGSGSRPSPTLLAGGGVAGSRPSPPGLGGSPVSTTDKPGKRFSYTFGHRYGDGLGVAGNGDGAGAGGAAGSASAGGERGAASTSSGGSGSAGRGEKAEGGASFLTSTEDDEELATFVQDIDARLAIKKRRAMREASERTVTSIEGGPGGEVSHPQSPTSTNASTHATVTAASPLVADVPWPRVVSDSPPRMASPPAISPSGGAGEGAGIPEFLEGSSTMPRRYRDHVDAELKRMNDEFAMSLVGLESGRPRRRVVSGRGAGSDSPSALRSSSSPSGSPHTYQPHQHHTLPLSSSSPRRFSSDYSPRRLSSDSPVAPPVTSRLAGSPLRTPLTLDDSSTSPSESALASGSGSGGGGGMPLPYHHRSGSAASARSDEVIGRLEWGEDAGVGNAGGQGGMRKARPFGKPTR